MEERLGEEEKRELLYIARRSIEEYVRYGKIPDFEVKNERLKQKGGAFVTINKNKELRGCIGNFFSDKPLYKTVIEMAISAATQDPRFMPLSEAELDEIDLEISVLSPLEKIDDPSIIEVGKHGIYIVKGVYRGVLLPQVAIEHGWDRETFLEHTCLKAGLPKDAWKKGVDIYVFTAQVFSEKEGDII